MYGLDVCLYEVYKPACGLLQVTVAGLNTYLLGSLGVPERT